MKLRCRGLREVVGIGVAPIGTSLEHRHELLYRDLSAWTEADDQNTVEDCKQLGLLTRATEGRMRHREYPDVSTSVGTR
jgi:hypothetical protein